MLIDVMVSFGASDTASSCPIVVVVESSERSQIGIAAAMMRVLVSSSPNCSSPWLVLVAGKGQRQLRWRRRRVLGAEMAALSRDARCAASGCMRVLLRLGGADPPNRSEPPSHSGLKTDGTPAPNPKLAAPASSGNSRPPRAPGLRFSHPRLRLLPDQTLVRSHCNLASSNTTYLLTSSLLPLLKIIRHSTVVDRGAALHP